MIWYDLSDAKLYLHYIIGNKIINDIIIETYSAFMKKILVRTCYWQFFNKMFTVHFCVIDQKNIDPITKCGGYGVPGKISPYPKSLATVSRVENVTLTPDHVQR